MNGHWFPLEKVSQSITDFIMGLEKSQKQKLHMYVKYIYIQLLKLGDLENVGKHSHPKKMKQNSPFYVSFKPYQREARGKSVICYKT